VDGLGHGELRVLTRRPDRHTWRAHLVGWALFSLAACATLACAKPPLRLEATAARGGFEGAHLRAGGFTLTRYLRVREAAATLVVYLEGDAPAWRERSWVAADPPPVAALALELAARDPAPAVAWLGRPCLPAAPEDERACEPSLWSHRRFSEPVVAALDAGLDALRAETGARRLELVGYSGGGVLAALLAARRSDVSRLVTLAAPLDLDAWVAHHGLAPLDVARAGALEPPVRVHLVGERDAVVPPAALADWARRHPEARAEVVAGMGHGGWADGWTERIARIRAETSATPAPEAP